jgi:type III pantothenate kinase
VDEYAVLVRSMLTMVDLDMSCVTGCAISCVVPPLTRQFRDLAERYLRVPLVMIGPKTYTGLRYEIDPSHDIGSDRLSNALAAYHHYGRKGNPIISIAFGTATAFDVITADGAYAGGAIAPGIGISAEALFRTAARLYQVELERPPAAIGKNTVQAMQSGVILGYTGLVEGLVGRIQRELGRACTVVATGGLADVIAGETTVIDVVEPYLTLEGIRLIYMLNEPDKLEGPHAPPTEAA